jgi:pimeloyl-ACP methyl ester carboxylesterase
MGQESPVVMMELLRPPQPPLPRCPVAVFGAVDDRLVPAGDVERTAARMGVPVAWVPDIGHQPMMDAGWDRMLDAILAWVSTTC